MAVPDGQAVSQLAPSKKNPASQLITVVLSPKAQVATLVPIQASSQSVVLAD